MKSNWRLQKQFKEDWLIALRSGEYEQGKSKLRQRGYDEEKSSFCCLGVACSISGMKNMDIKGSWIENSDIFTPIFKSVPKELFGSYNPITLERFNSMQIEDWKEKLDPYQVLAAMNDGGKTFLEIADFIEANFETYD